MPCRLLDPALPASVLVPALLTYGQLARLSRENYPVLAEVCCSGQCMMHWHCPISHDWVLRPKFTY